MTSELKPCPFCTDGGEPIHIYAGCRCDRCGATINDWENETGAERWNTRSPCNKDAVIAELARALREYSVRRRDRIYYQGDEPDDGRIAREALTKHAAYIEKAAGGIK